MNPEAKQKLIGIFVEEARDCLQTLEQGLPVLSERSTDGALVDELCRAAHSIKGGAVMLEMDSVRRTAHRMEDTLKVFRGTQIRCDRDLQSLLLRCNETLVYLIDNLQSPVGLSPDEGNRAISEIEPVFHQLELQAKVLRGEISAADSGVPADLGASSASIAQKTTDVVLPSTQTRPQIPRPSQELFAVPTVSPSRIGQSADVLTSMPRPAQPQTSFAEPESSLPTVEQEPPQVSSPRSSIRQRLRERYLPALRRLVRAIVRYIRHLARRAYRASIDALNE